MANEWKVQLHLSTMPAKWPPWGQPHFQGLCLPLLLFLGGRERETLGTEKSDCCREVAIMGRQGCNIVAVAVCGQVAILGVQ